MEENAYLELCNKMKELYDDEQKQKENENGFYRLTVIVPKFDRTRFDTHHDIKIEYDTKNVIVNCPHILMEKVCEKIREHGCVHGYTFQHLFDDYYATSSFTSDDLRPFDQKSNFDLHYLNYSGCRECPVTERNVVIESIDFTITHGEFCIVKIEKIH